MNNKVTNRDGVINSLQVSRLYSIPAGDFNPGIYFLIKNITEEPITASIQLANQDTPISTILYPGWNVEICNKITGVTANTLQYGY